MQHRVRFPIAVKLSILLLAASVLPLVIASWWNVRRGIQSVEATALRNLQLLATVTATRIDQLILDTSRAQQLIAGNGAFENLCAAPPETRAAQLPAAQQELAHAVRTNPDIASALVTDTDGICLASTNPPNVGMDLKFREYVRRALAGEQFVSEILVGKTTHEPGIYFSGPIRDGSGRTVGAMILKMHGETIYRICDQAAVAGAGGFAVIVDRDGIIISHPVRTLIYKSLGKLSADDIARINPQLRYGLDEIQPLGMDDLAEHLLRADSGGSVSFFSPRANEPMISGFAPMSGRPWIMAVVERRAEFDAPLRQLRREQVLHGAVVAVAAVALGLLAARLLVRPLRNLTEAAGRVARGDWTARAAQTTEDEIGALAQTFNAMVPQLQERAKLEDALRLAQEIQRHLLPTRPPQIAGLDVAGVNIPADQTGGDYFDFLDLSSWRPGTLAVAVGDVTGHGVAAALLMATGRALLRSRAVPPGELTDLLKQVNVRLHEDVPDGRFMTLIYALIDRCARTVALVSAGHDPILLYDPAADTFRDLEGDDIPLGIDATWHFTQKSWDSIPTRCVLFFGTDGVWETRSPSGEMFGKERLQNIIRAHAAEPSEKIIQAVTRAIREFRGSVPQHDDVTVVVIRFVPE
jgi:serine phosphatase RsbU (regulator of sigma subunit)